MAKSILVLYANSGFHGHKAIAENYANLLKDKGYRVNIADVYDIDRNLIVKLGLSCYFLVLRRTPWLWRWLYNYWIFIPGVEWFRTSLLPCVFPVSRNLITAANAEIVITTHPVSTSIVNYLISRGRVRTILFTTFSDWHTQEFWIFPFVDKYLVPSKLHRDELIQRGYKDEQVIVTGMLLANEYYQAPTKEEARLLLSLPNDTPVILVMGGGKGWAIEKIAAALAKVRMDAQIILIGSSEVRKTEILRDLVANNWQERFEVTGFVEPSLYFAAADLLISKPGGLTTAQAFLLKLPVIPAFPLPGHEDENLKVLMNSKATLPLLGHNACANDLLRILRHKKRLEQVTSAAYSLSPAHTPEKIVDLVRSELCT